MKNKLSSRPQHVLYLQIVTTVAILAVTLLVTHNNSAGSVPIYLFMLLVGIGCLLLLGKQRGGLISLVLIAIWIRIKQVTGVWTGGGLFLNILEITLVGLVFLVTGLYRGHMKTLLDRLAEIQLQLKKLDLEDKGVGLIRASIGLLRLREEEAQSRRDHRPFSLVLMAVLPQPGMIWEAGEATAIMRCVAEGVKGTTRDVDIPFLAADDRIAVILPETDIPGANQVVSSIVKRMTTARFVTQSGLERLIQECAQLRFGFATFLGESNTPIDLFRAAEQSLNRNMETNLGKVFQNLFIEWVKVGERPSLMPVISSTGRRESKRQVPALDENQGMEGRTPSGNDAVPDGKEDQASMVKRVIDHLKSE